jgi:hypothetical protein
MRILFGLATRVVLAMDGDPFARDHAGREPEPKPEKMTDDGVQSERPMRLVAVQKDGDARDRHVRQPKSDGDVTPER